MTAFCSEFKLGPGTNIFIIYCIQLVDNLTRQRHFLVLIVSKLSHSILCLKDGIEVFTVLGQTNVEKISPVLLIIDPAVGCMSESPCTSLHVPLREGTPSRVLTLSFRFTLIA